MVWHYAVEFYNKLFDDKSDPRIGDWVMTKNPLPTLFICLSYVYIVKYLGPNLMKNRKPLDIRWMMIIYNFSMVIFNIIIFYGLGIYGWFGLYNYKCQPVDYSSSPEALGMLTIAWWYYISKMVDFTDTIIFVMRKKYNQITTLHVVHHSLMPMSCWFGLKLTPGGHSTFFAFVNSFVHILMYSYYGLAAIGPQMNKYLWWKKYMTTIQMIQFILIFVHAFQLLFRDCNYPKAFVWWIGLHAVLFWFLFADFYKNTYSKAKNSKNLNGKAPKSDEMEKSLMNGNSAMNGTVLSEEREYDCKKRVCNNNGTIHCNEETSLKNNGVKKVN